MCLSPSSCRNGVSLRHHICRLKTTSKKSFSLSTPLTIHTHGPTNHSKKSWEKAERDREKIAEAKEGKNRGERKKREEKKTNKYTSHNLHSNVLSHASTPNVFCCCRCYCCYHWFVIGAHILFCYRCCWLTYWNSTALAWDLDLSCSERENGLWDLFAFCCDWRWWCALLGTVEGLVDDTRDWFDLGP